MLLVPMLIAAAIMFVGSVLFITKEFYNSDKVSAVLTFLVVSWVVVALALL